MKRNIVLIGMPGVGKSTVGVILAKVLGYRFIDADLVIQERENRLLSEIIAQDGLEGFLRAEENANIQVANEAKKAVIATGGSVVYCSRAMEKLSETGQIVYLKLDYDTLDKRLSNLKGRGDSTMSAYRCTKNMRISQLMRKIWMWRKLYRKL